MTTQQGLLTAEEFAALPHEGLRLELIRGELHAMAPSYADHGAIVGALHAELGFYIRRNQLGKIYGAETGFLIARDPDTVRAPNIAFIQASRVTPAASAPNWNPVIPDLIVEVISSSDRDKEVASKIQVWLDAGVRLVWMVYPARREIVVHRADSATTLTDSDTLDGAEVVPGFTLPVAEVFGA